MGSVLLPKALLGRGKGIHSLKIVCFFVFSLEEKAYLKKKDLAPY
jgi:hypothetical protein